MLHPICTTRGKTDFQHHLRSLQRKGKVSDDTQTHRMEKGLCSYAAYAKQLSLVRRLMILNHFTLPQNEFLFFILQIKHAFYTAKILCI